jgi:hypothetical protein
MAESKIHREPELLRTTIENTMRKRRNSGSGLRNKGMVFDRLKKSGIKLS